MTARRPSVVRIAALVPAVAVLLGAVVAGSASAAPQQDQQDGPTRSYQVSATFSASGRPAVTYDPARVPVGANVSVAAQSENGTTITTLQVRGLRPNTVYGAHAHVANCGVTGDVAGPHFQFRPDLVQPSVDPAFANAQNEIWLDLTTDAEGAGRAQSTVAWVFPADRRAKSVVLHDMATMTAPGKAGTAGGRSACVDVKF
ncbi:Cu-Zn family superoxide dismutase [Pseudonocardia sediminis]|uniref:Cu-Zn family superoxide dismutase n=1 Tax=Pseudonocardia sediminis TaxID=1397368 RepID=A0A4Q7UUG5_PSEST|nr:superoxide dismutase [Pseudonocardia sediminis]RZT83659.1 Cu-Zn family superoxide dismutase [Pseudonocardia sediminis]